MTLLKVQKIAQKIEKDLSDWRRELHRYPEPSFQEYRTQAFIRQRLLDWGLAPRDIGGTGLVLDLQGTGTGPLRALRADIDALPIQEAHTHSYCSQNPGFMHACGHDAHTTCLLGAIFILQEMRHAWQGQVRCIFQPGEEKLPGGASLLLQEGIFADQKPQALYGQHVEPNMPVGKIGICSGPFMAAADELYLKVQGKGGHAARPQECRDAVLGMAQTLMLFQQIASRFNDPLQPLVLSFGKIFSEGGATNILPDVVRAEGTLRCFDNHLRAEIHEQLQRICQGLSLSLDLHIELEIVKGYPPVYNDPNRYQFVRKHAAAYLGPENLVELPPRMGAEDFGSYAQVVPANFHRLGTLNPYGTGLHTPQFDIDEAALPIGAGLMAFLAMQNDV